MKKYISKPKNRTKTNIQIKPHSVIRIKNLSPHESIAKKLDEINERLLYKNGISIYDVINQCKQLEMFSYSSLENTYDCVQYLERLDDSENIITSLVDLTGSSCVSVNVMNELVILIPVSIYREYKKDMIKDFDGWVYYPLNLSDY